MRTGPLAQVRFWVPTALNILLSAGLAVLYAFHTQTHQVAVYGILVTLIGFFLLVPWYPARAWRWMKYLVALLPPWLLLSAMLMILQEPAFQRSDYFFLAQFSVFFFLQNFFLYFRLDRWSWQVLMVGFASLLPLILTFIWAGLRPEDPYTWPLSEYAFLHFTMVLVVILLNILSVTNFIAYLWSRVETSQKSLRQEIVNLREIEEGYYLYENFFKINQILSEPALDIEEAMRRVMKVLTDMEKYGLLQKGAFFLTEPGGQSLRMLVQYNADNLLATCQQVQAGRCLCGRVLVSGQPLHKSCVDHEHEFHPSGMKPHGHYVLPIQWEGERLGVFTLYVADGTPYSQRTMGFLQMVSSAIAKRLVVHRQKEQLHKLIHEQLEVIQAGNRAGAWLMQAILPSEKLLRARWRERSALWFQPAGELGGDFYFFYERGEQVYFGVGDAEGHGAMGAILSSALMSALQLLLPYDGEHRPADILRNLHETLLQMYGEAEALLRNGADLLLCQYDREKRRLRYAGARLPLLYSTNGKIEILEPIPAAIGSERMARSSFFDAELPLRPGMRLYLMSDGLASQLAGDPSQTQTKFGRRRLYELLAETTHLSPPDQLSRVQAAIREWQGMASQTDDITLWILDVAEG
jgi:serine phosphatase RsbU (regulator of sigma subunit)